MKLSKKRYTYGTSYGGRFYFRWDNKEETGVFVDPHPSRVSIEFNYTTPDNMLNNETAEPCSKADFFKAVQSVKAAINKLK